MYVSRVEPTRRTFVMPPRNNSAKFAVRLKAAAIKKTQINISTEKRHENAEGITNPESAKTKNDEF